MYVSMDRTAAKQTGSRRETRDVTTERSLVPKREGERN